MAIMVAIGQQACHSTWQDAKEKRKNIRFMIYMISRRFRHLATAGVNMFISLRDYTCNPDLSPIAGLDYQLGKVGIYTRTPDVQGKAPGSLCSNYFAVM